MEVNTNHHFLFIEHEGFMYVRVIDVVNALGVMPRTGAKLDHVQFAEDLRVTSEEMRDKYREQNS